MNASHPSFLPRRLAFPVCLAAALALAGCNMTERMNVPMVTAAQPISVSTPSREQASVALGRVVVSIPVGQTIAHFPASGNKTEGTFCNYRHSGKSTIDWSEGSREFGDWRSEFGRIFFNTLRDRGVNIVGDPQDLFRQNDAVQSAEYLIGARIKDIKGNLCHSHHWWDGRPLQEVSGEMWMSIEWSIFSNLHKRTVAQFETEGYYRQQQAKKHGLSLTFYGTFAAAAENLLGEQKFIQTVERRAGQGAASQVSAAANPNAGQAPLILPRVRNLTGSIRQVRDRLVAAVVTVRSGGGHGSGFVISRDGYVMTNEHVVKDASRVQIIFANGLEVTGQVLRRDRARDVALVRIPIRARSVLPIRRDGVRQLDEVYAIGSPIFESLEATVTKGIVSGLRPATASWPAFIQADVPISGGNSGGPLVDKSGNVVGVTVASVNHPEAENLNLFIPIGEALDTLNIQIDPPRSPGAS